MKRCFVTFEEVISLENLTLAWQEFIRGKRKKKDVQVFALHLGDELMALNEDLVTGLYVHGSYHNFKVNDPKPRDIHKATVRDRLLHHAIHRKLYPYFAHRFIADSYSCQTDKGVHRALERFTQFTRKASWNNTRTCWVLKGDIKKFFASINHAILENILREHLEDKRLSQLLTHVIESFSSESGRGIPLGNLTSQLFANVYLDVFDQYVKRHLKVRHYLRYADDFLLLSPDRDQLVQTLPFLSRFLSERCKLALHPNKIFLKTLASGVDVLGWVHFPNHRVPRTKTKRKAFKRNRAQLKPEMLQSYLGLFHHGDAFEAQCQLLNDYWLFDRNRDPQHSY